MEHRSTLSFIVDSLNQMVLKLQFEPYVLSIERGQSDNKFAVKIQKRDRSIVGTCFWFTLVDDYILFDKGENRTKRFQSMDKFLIECSIALREMRKWRVG